MWHSTQWRSHSAILFFFFSSRRRHTRYWRDWSSDVCSSDLEKVDQHTARCRGDESDDDGGEDAQIVLERLVRAEDRKPRERERLEVRQYPREIGRASCRERV